jgi:2-(1,2-epoxy-1,2-dihydrophenyl)acetyl-CoA isomerase
MGDETASTEVDGSVTEDRDGSVLRITIDRPNSHNALTRPMIDSFVDILTGAAVDDSLRAVHIRGAGADFCSGVDLTSGNDGSRRPRAGDILRRIPLTAHRVIELVHTIHLPVLCSVRGWAAGLGCNLALAADFTVAASDAVFWEPFLGRGFSPDSGSTWMLARLAGMTRAKQMLLLGDKVAAPDAVDWGLIYRCVDEPELDDVAGALLRRLAAAPTVAYGLTKQALAQAQHSTLAQAMTQELLSVELSCRTQDFKEGMAAFAQRRPPRFQGR